VTGGIDFAAEGLLDGLDGDAREERRDLLERLHEQGFALDELRAAVEDGRLLFLPAERLVGGRPELSARDVVERGGISMEMFMSIRRALGLPEVEPDVKAFNESDAGAGMLLNAFHDAGVSDEQMLAMARVLGRGMAQITDVMRTTAVELSQRPGQTELEFAEEHTRTVERLMPLVGPLLDGVARLHLRHVVDAELIARAEQRSTALPGARTISVAFADLVGFTRLGEQVPPDELDRIAQRLEAITTDVLPPQVRFVKSLGDAVMLVSPDAAPLLTATLELVDAAEAEGDDFPQLHIGMATGEALSRAGDWYGRPVNLASRITGVARPGSVLVSEEVREAAPDAATWSFAGERKLKGLPAAVKLFRARRPDAPEGDGPREG
jgi:adenylate cyclase